MKKILAMLSILFLLPLTANALMIMEDQALDNVSGQMGITIDVYDLQMANINLGIIGLVDADGWGDTNGTLNDEGYDSFAYFPIGNLSTLTGYPVGTDINNVSVNVRGLTIDAAQPNIAADPLYGMNPFLRIGTGDIAISTGTITSGFAGVIVIDGVSMTITDAVAPGYIDIGSTTGNGLDIRITDLDINYISTGDLAWGDMDGWTCPPPTGGWSHTNPGWIGLNGGITIAGAMPIDAIISIDVGTDPTNSASNAPGTTKLRIGIGNMDIGAGSSISLTPSLGNNPGLGQDLIMLQIMDFSITGMSGIIDIYAH